MGAATNNAFFKNTQAFRRSRVNELNSSNDNMFGLDNAAKAGSTAFGDTANAALDRQRSIDASVAEAGKNTDLTGQIIKSVARAEMARKKTGMTRESTFVSERSSASDLDAQRKRYPSQNQYTPKPPPGVK